MGIIEGILAAIIAVFKSIPVISKWFEKSAQQNVDKAQETTTEELDKAKKTGRPNWR